MEIVWPEMPVHTCTSTYLLRSPRDPYHFQRFENNKTVRMAMTHIKGKREQVCLTPEWLYGLLNARMGPFDFDPAPSPRPDDFDGLDYEQPWGMKNFLNPPYHNLELWVNRALHELKVNGKETVILCPFRPHMKWWLMNISGVFAVFPVIGYVRFRGFKDELPHSLSAVWISNATTTLSQRCMQEGILRPNDIGLIRSGKRVRHDAACTKYPGAILNNEGNIIFEGPVCPFIQLENLPSETTFKRK
jgi:hypothetical protein